MSSSVDPAGYGMQSQRNVIRLLSRPDPRDTPAMQQKHKMCRLICFASAILIAILILVLLGILAYFFLFSSDPDFKERPENNRTFTDPADNNTISNHDSWTAMQLKKHMNLSVSPCEDFYEYACGGWLGNKDIQRMKQKVSVASFMNDALNQQLIKLLRQLPNERDPQHRLQPRRYFVACLNSGRLEQRGPKPFLDFLKDVGHFSLLDGTLDKSLYQITKAAAKLTLLEMNHIFKFHVRPEEKNSTRFLVTAPDIPMIDEEVVRRWMEYNLKQLGVNVGQDFGSAVTRILDYEKKLRQEAKNSNESIFAFDLDSISTKESMILWKDLFKMYGITADKKFAVKHLQYFVNLNTTSFDRITVMNFFLKQFLNLSLCLSPRFRPLESFMPSHAEPDRQQICLGLTRKTLPDQLARLYVDEVYRLQSDAFVQETVACIKDLLSNKSSENAYFDPSASSAAASEVNLIVVKTGYMDYLQDTQALENIFTMKSDSDLFESHLSFLKFRFNQSLYAKEDTNSWLRHHSPLDLDVDFQALEHYLTIPAALLQLPMINSTWPSSMKFGSMGTYLGRVLAKIYLKNLFTASKAPTNDEKIAQNCFIRQYSGYVFDGYQVNGEHGLDDNILDLEGLTLGYEAFEKHVSQADKEAVLPGFSLSHQQLFFLVFAQRLCQHIPVEMSEAEVTEGRLPNKIRVNGCLKNSKSFADAYKCSPGSPMNPVTKCKFI